MLALLLLAPCLSHAQKKVASAHRPSAAKAPKPVDAYYGFRNFKLGSDISAHPELEKLVDVDGATKQIYQLPNEVLKVGQADLERIQYTYYDGKLQSVLIVVDGGTNRHFLLEAFKTKYGKPSFSTEDYDYSDKHLWQGSKAVIMFGAANSEDKSNILIMSEILRAKEKADAANGL